VAAAPAVGGQVEGWRRVARAHPYVVDAVISLATYAITLAEPLADTKHRYDMPDLANVLCATALCLALVFRRRWPRAVLAVALVLVPLSTIGGHGHPPYLLGSMVAVGTAVGRTNRPASIWLGLVSVAVLGAVAAIGATGPADVPTITGATALAIAAFAIGEASRSRRAYIAEVEERARRAEQSREEEARRRVGEERVRIARDLHDLVGHHIALISVQAGVAGHVFDEQPDKAKQAIAQVRTACRAALEELATTISLLRAPDEARAPTEPTVGLAQLPALTASFTAAGLRVDQVVEGVARPIPPAVDLTAYRVIQESLTNVHKHAGPAAATVRVSYGPAVLSILVEDDGIGPAGGDPGGPGAPGEGHGILGMRERAVALGGALRVGARPGGGFQVRVTLPAPALPDPAQPNPAQPNPAQPNPAQPNPAQPNPAGTPA
jgi:signal transduction histidine kinase